MPQPCTICACSVTAAKVTTLVAEGVSDRAIAEQLGLGRMSVGRHRKNHILAPAKAMTEAAAKGADAALQPATSQPATAQAADPVAFLSLPAIVADIQRAQDRLERMSHAAERSGAGGVVATLTGQQLRAAELRAKIGGAGAFGRGEAPAPGCYSVTSPITIVMLAAEATQHPDVPVIEGEAVAGTVALPAPGGQVVMQLGD